MAVDNIIVPPDLSTTVNLDETDTLTVAPGSLIYVPDSDAIRWDLDPDPSPLTGGVVIFNAGQIISDDGQGIDTLGTGVGRSLTLINLGELTATDEAIRINDALVGGKIDIDNSGIIQSIGKETIDLNAITAAASVTISNRITGTILSQNDDAIKAGENSVINNDGKILAQSAGGTSSDGINFNEHNGTVNNGATGQIIAARHGITGGEGAAISLTINNAGVIVGNLGSGINLDTASTSITYVTNSGTISGTSGGEQDGDGVDIDGLINLDNSGKILAFGVPDEGLSEAITIGGGTIVNRADGLIESVGRAINVDDSDNGDAFAATTIINDGVINGKSGQAIRIVGGFNDTITNRGTILGDVATGGGDDQINLYTGSRIVGLVDGGNGNDTLTLYGAGRGIVASTMNMESLIVASGAWTINEVQSYSHGVRVQDGAHLRLGEGGEIDDDIDVDGVFSVDRSDLIFLTQQISGSGVFEQAGSGTTVLSHEYNTYEGGTVLTRGTLVIAALGAAGYGDITFTRGAQTLGLTEDAFSGDAYTPHVFDFGKGDTIDLYDFDFKAGATARYDAVSELLTVKSGGESIVLHIVDPGVFAFSVARDAEGGTTIVAKNVGETIVGKNGRDQIDASHTTFGQVLPTAADDHINGRGGQDRLAGLAGDDVILGSGGRDQLSGGAGNDLLSGGAGINVVTGGGGYDAFLFNAAVNGANVSRITDFKIGVDVIELSHDVFSGFDLGPLSPGQFRTGGVPGNGQDYILYKAATGAIFYDNDGNGGHAPVLFARVAAGLHLTADDFLVV